MPPKLYLFQNLEKLLDKLGYPKVAKQDGYKVIKADFEKVFREGKVSFENDNTEGIFVEYDGKIYRGYMYIKEPHLSRYGTRPKLHTQKCKTIQDFIAKGLFNQRYEFSNSATNDLIDIDTGTLYPNETLEVCHNCRKQSAEEIGQSTNSQEFFERVAKKYAVLEDVEVDIFGYVKDWPQISRHFRQQQGYRCQHCGLTPRDSHHRKYWHVDHISGDKLDNRLENLQCLCIRCHSQKDHRHQENFKKPRMQRDLEKFNELYPIGGN